MREAWHTNNKKTYIIPQDLTKEEIENHKQIAKKGTFLCPYCKAKLYVKSGEIHGNYFSHLHSESCEESKKSDARHSQYEKQKKSDSSRHPQILAMMFDELDVLSKVYPHLSNSYGYLNPEFTKFIPDISLKINEHIYAITIVTNITSLTDATKAKNIEKQREYYTALGYDPLFFIERSNLGIDIDKQSLVLWASEKEALTIQNADENWMSFLSNLAPVNELQEVLNLPYTDLNVKSIMYITPADQEIAIEAFHVVEHPNTSPVKVHFLSKPYKLNFSQAFKLANDILTLANLQIELENQSKYSEKFRQAKHIYQEEQKEKEQQVKIDTEHKRKSAEEKSRIYREGFKNNTYNTLDKENKVDRLKKMFNSNK
ncbi:competence protein CoiA family protein [Planococcus sp. N028]|uniref:Competence protein CoiA family protein n=1 Tax=Planococcus shixiaomingii TaxID=3058393 RepID=A0ABT8N725_9BACL|nr:competence protein CoiA family protein [Planococcus sp. N028]MDN7243533.1 competence protein CoiA family protein [Planococcus sp. N028]